MRDTAVLVYISPKVASNYTIWCLEKVAGEPVIGQLFKRLKRGLPLGEFEYFILHHARVVSRRLQSDFKEPPARLFESPALTRQKVIETFLKAQPNFKTVLIFPENCIFPDCQTTLQMLQKHRAERSDVTFSKEYPEGLLPVIYEKNALQRLVELGWQENASLSLTDVIEKANEVAAPDDDFRFKVGHFEPRAATPGPVVEKLPVSLLVSDCLALQAADHALSVKEQAHAVGAAQAYLFKQALLRKEFDEPPVFNLVPSASDKPTVLFSTAVGGFTGAEMCFFDLIAHMDPRRYHPVVLLPYEGLLSEMLRKAGLPVEIGRFSFSALTPWKLLFFRLFLKQWRVRLVHINGRGNESLLVAAHELGLPIVRHVRVLEGFKLPAEAKFASRLIAISKVVAKDIQRADVPVARIRLVYDGQDTETFKPGLYERDALRRQMGIAGHAPVILMIARVTPQKRVDFFLRALPAVAAKFPDVLALIVGENTLEDFNHVQNLKALTAALHLEKNVKFWGFEKEIAKMHAVADLVVNCTIDEPLGHSIQEAMAMGLPVVVPNRGGPAEFVRHYDNGVLYDPFVESSFSAELIRLLSNPDLRQKLGASARQTMEGFTMDRHVQEVCAVYNELLTPGPNAV